MLAEDEDPLATSEWSPSMGCRHWARGDNRWQLLGAGRLLLLLLGARGRAVASSAVVATRAPLSTAVAPAAAIAVGGLRAASAPGARVGRG